MIDLLIYAAIFLFGAWIGARLFPVYYLPPSCFGSNPTWQEQSEFGCEDCMFLDECSKRL